MERAGKGVVRPGVEREAITLVIRRAKDSPGAVVIAVCATYRLVYTAATSVIDTRCSRSSNAFEVMPTQYMYVLTHGIGFNSKPALEELSTSLGHR